MYESRTVNLIIPALNEESSIADVVRRVDGEVVDRIIVVDNGSTDGTARAAQSAGAQVVYHPVRGYGEACFAGFSAADGDVVVFMDADGSDDPSRVHDLLRVMEETGAAMVLGSRIAGTAERGALTLSQQLGNRLACVIMRLLWGSRYTDLGPMRAVERRVLEEMGMREMGFGWTVEMQVKAAQRKLPVSEIPVPYLKRSSGDSKISGNLRGAVTAGARILAYLGAAKLKEILR